MLKLALGDRLVGDGEPCFIVAEIGENPNGDVELASAMIREAALAGADAVKFQTITAEELFNPSTPQYARRKQVEMDHSKYHQLIDSARDNNVIFFSTPFDEPSADFLDGLGVGFFKIGSGELTHHSFLRHVARKGKPMVISTGMARPEWIDAAVRVVKETGNDQIIVTHCVSVYPAPIELANIRAVPFLRNRLEVLVGFSDHTMSDTAPLAAVALGACYIEKHFTISRDLPEGDNEISYEPREFQVMTEGIRQMEIALGRFERSILTEEEPLVKLARRGIYSRQPILQGQLIESSMLAVRRPLGPISAECFDSVVGKLAKVDLPAETPLEWEHLACQV